MRPPRNRAWPCPAVGPGVRDARGGDGGAVISHRVLSEGKLYGLHIVLHHLPYPSTHPPRPQGPFTAPARPDPSQLIGPLQLPSVASPVLICRVLFSRFAFRISSHFLSLFLSFRHPLIHSFSGCAATLVFFCSFFLLQVARSVPCCECQTFVCRRRCYLLLLPAPLPFEASFPLPARLICGPLLCSSPPAPAPVAATHTLALNFNLTSPDTFQSNGLPRHSRSISAATPAVFITSRTPHHHYDHSTLYSTPYSTTHAPHPRNSSARND